MDVLSRFNIEEVRDRADKNLASAILHRNKLAPYAKRVVEENYMMYTLGVANADGHLNGVICLGSKKQEGLLQEAINFFKDEKKDFVVWVRDHRDQELENELKSKGYSAMREPGIAGMMIGEPINNLDTPEGYSLKKVESLKGISDYAKVVKEAFDKEDEILDAMYGHVESLMATNINAYVLYEGDTPVAAASTLLSDGVAGIYYLAALEEHRGKGIGSYMTMVATNSGFEMGADAVILQASLLGEPIYKKLGYKVITHYRWYKIEV